MISTHLSESNSNVILSPDSIRSENFIENVEMPFLSVLNTVIDHKMIDPTPLEPLEFRDGNQVPVLRTFGPILRNGIEEEPLQSCCLYIHGAFPYLLARPVAAGPDGSSTFSSGSSDVHTNWDCVSSIQSIALRIQTTLESMIQASLENKDQEASGLHPNKKKTAVIRRISVVVGRGFYTYCPGPAAPFLRVEYYDPKIRWKIKMMLERGLDLPKAYHPDPLQYNNNTQAIADVLSFHCYEAHIPYTMQFFKDYNLSGMSYIHLCEGGKFRSPLPKNIRIRSGRPTVANANAMFLQRNTSPLHIWNDKDVVSKFEVGNQQSLSVDVCQESSLLNSQQPIDHSWKNKETSCDVEFDCTVDQILNVKSVLTKSNPEDGVHWRAVPSLYEIWRQERRRMARLLPAKEDFLREQRREQSPSFTLNVKKNASLPGTKLAVLGMKNLFKCSDGLLQSLRRAISQITRRYPQQVYEVGKRISSRKLEFEKLLPSQKSHVLSDNDNDALEALEALEGQFASVNSVLAENNNTLESLGGQLDGVGSILFSQLSDGHDNICASNNYEELSELFSQRVDRGEDVQSCSHGDIEEYINPQTLTPFDDIEDNDDEEDETQFEHTLTLLANEMTKHRVENSYKKHSQDLNLTSMSTRKEVDDWLNSNESSDSDDSIESVKEKNRFNYIIHELPIGEDQTSEVYKDTTITCTAPQFSKLQTQLFRQKDSNHNDPKWLIHTSKYLELRRSMLAEGKVVNSWGPRLNEGDIVILPVLRPPSRKRIELWCQKQDRKMHEKDIRKSNELDEKKNDAKISAHQLQIDGNSRKLTVGARERKQTNFSGSTKQPFHGIEEIEWKLSQQLFSQSQSQRPLSSPYTNDDLNSSKNYSEGILRNKSPFSSQGSSAFLSQTGTSNSVQPLEGIGAQGGRIYIEGGGGLKSKTKASQKISNNTTRKGISSLELPTPLTVMSIEIHIQCRTGKAGVNDSKKIAMKPNSDKDKVSAVAYIYAKDPGGGEKLELLERGCLFIPVEAELKDMKHKKSRLDSISKRIKVELPPTTMAMSSPTTLEAVRDEKQLLLRLSSIVRWRDPDMLISWDPQGSGLGFLIERGVAIGNMTDSKQNSPGSTVPGKVDLARLLGRIPTEKKASRESKTPLDTYHDTINRNTEKINGGEIITSTSDWKGSGLGAEWDERVGAGAAAASIDGRLVFSGWKLVAEEVKHANSSYLPAMVSTVLGKRIPYHDDIRLTQWYGFDKGKDRWRTINYRLTQALASLLIMDALDIIGRAGEAARLSGVEFSQSFPGIRGSQYKVEGVLLRALKSIQSDERGSKKGVIRSFGSEKKSLSIESKSQTQSPWKLLRGIARECSTDSPFENKTTRSYFFYSPGVNDTNKQEALECQALTLEPRSGIQADPVVVCDFTALYPSLVIAYNLCYSTCAGKLEYHSTRGEMRQEGRTTGKVGPFLYPEARTATVLTHHLKSLTDEKLREAVTDDEKYSNDRAYVAPTGAIFISESVLKGVLPLVLDELLSTRAMLKKAAKRYKQYVTNLSPAILRQLEARQLALKYVANVTYGYTSATFSGRCAMPLLADTIVECGRRTLTNAMNLATKWGTEKDGRWFGAEVIYGDTDSLFVKLPGRSINEAFEFGEQFCKAVTTSNPPPVQLKLEKVYYKSMMQTKKKYCGMKIETLGQKKPVFEAKGIETIRRDQCNLTQKVLRNALIVLFQNGLDAVKSYLFRQWTLIMAGNIPVSDFILTGRVKSKYRGGGVGPVQAVLARRLAEADPGRVIRHKERLAYVIVATPGITFRLRDCVLTPTELLEQWDAYTIHSAYYISKHVNAALQRCLGLAPYHIDIKSWFEACPKPRKRIQYWPTTRSGNNLMISSYFGSDICSLCGTKCRAQGSAQAVVCSACRQEPVKATTTALRLLNQVERDSKEAASVCSSCNSCFEDASTFAALKQPRMKQGNLLISMSHFKKSHGIVTPIANCICIDCPNTFQRHRLKENEIEARATCEALGIL